MKDLYYHHSSELKTSNAKHSLKVREIAMFYSMNKITFAVTFDNKEHIIDLSLEKLEEQLDPEVFFRTNRQTLCNIESIITVEPWYNGKLIVQTDPDFSNKIVISREKARMFKEWFSVRRNILHAS